MQNMVILALIIISMGLFNKLYSQFNSEEPMTNQQPISLHQEKWDFYFTNVDDKLGSIFVDLGIKSVAPMSDKQNLVWVIIKMNNPRNDGLSSLEESELLIEIEDSLVDQITSNHNSIYVGRLTSAGNRYLYFYFGDTILYDKTISEVMISFPDYQFDYGTNEDENWNNYFDFLFPSPKQYRCMQNQHVIEYLEKSGDKLTKPREVFHWIYFKSVDDRELFLENIKNDNFSIVDADYDNSWGEFSYSLQIKRVDKVDQESVDEIVLYLWNLANVLNAVYDGWETSIEID